MKLLKAAFFIGPILFGLLFLAPLIMQVMQRMEWSAPFGLTHLTFALIIGGILGAIATWRGRWI